MKNYISGVSKNSIGEQSGIEAGDILLEINGKKVLDVFDYRYLISDCLIIALIEKQNGELWEIEIEKDEFEDLGISFAEPMMDKAKYCCNRCIFCFIDQLPKGMRDTLYFKDDDTRLSFLTGNYVTLTNISDKALDRIIFYHFSPINVSVHATDGVVRTKMLRNKKAANIMRQLKRLSSANIDINCQIVLVKGVNDGDCLKRSITELMGVKGVKSVSVVPVGITKYRDNLYPIEPFTKEDAERIIADINQMQIKALSLTGACFVFASDEFYIKAGADLPDYQSYDDFPQLENGVGMLRMFEQEFNEMLKELSGDSVERRVYVVTGKSASHFIMDLSNKLMQKFINTFVETIVVENTFFGADVTVSGLLTGKDILNAITFIEAADKVLVPSNCFKADEDIFLDDMTIDALNSGVKGCIIKTPCDGKSFILNIVGN